MDQLKKQNKAGVSYHIRPPYGLLNDPNGLVQFKGIYHVFYQWNQHGFVHETKSWGHVTSPDLIHWTTQQPALEPSKWYDKDGCYSGSAVIHEEKLVLFYTGTVKVDAGEKISFQCMAISEDGFTFRKCGPLFEHPAGYTRHVRDPKVWQDDQGKWWMILGAQTEGLIGKVLLYSSMDLENWSPAGSLLKQPLALGYMWECPDLMLFPKKDVLLLSPQGLEPEGDFYHNIFQSGYLTGNFDREGTFHPDSQPFRELDRGFEFYAPQTFTDESGRRLLFAWMGAMEPDVEQSVPTIRDGWLHHLSIPREIKLEQNKLIQKPAKELEKLRCEEFSAGIDLVKKGFSVLPAAECEMILRWKKGANCFLSLRKEVEIRYSAEQKRLTVERTGWLDGKRETRSVVLEQDLYELRIYLEETCLEMFVNGGREVFSLRYFVQEESLEVFLSNGSRNLSSAVVYMLER